jgi:hypothetical protein
MRRHMVRAIREAEESDAPETDQVRLLAARFGAESADAADAADAAAQDEDDAEPSAPTPGVKARHIQSTALQASFHKRFPWYQRFRDVLRANRIRPHLFSGIEFQMGVFIVAPLVGVFSTTGMLATIVASSALMFAFEALIIYKLWLSTREFARVKNDINTVLSQIVLPEQHRAA